MYRLHPDIGVIRLADEVHILPIKSDPSWIEYQAWVTAGNVPDPAPIVEPPLPEVVVPQKVTMRQARIALHRAGLLASVDSAIASLPEPQRTEAQIEWEYSQEVQRHNGFVAILAPILGLDDAALDALFTLADTL